MAELVFLKDIERDPNTVLTVGTFDGVHKGHKALIKKVVEKAEKRNARSVIVSFDPHPREIINSGPESIELLTTLKERSKLMEKLGVDILLIIPFTRDFSLKSSEEFVEEDLFKKIGIEEFVIGYDHHFGKDRQGSIDTVEKMSKELNFEAYVVSKKEVGETTVSSTKIRNLLSQQGDIKKASNLLGWPYSLEGMVVHGQKRGKSIGFPTANLVVDNQKKLIPANGVYAVKVDLNNQTFKGMMNIGYRPTFKDDSEKSMEVYIFDFSRDIYGQTLKVVFVDKIRDEQKFESKQDLIDQLYQDKKIAQKLNL